MDRLYSIKDISNDLGISLSTIRKYEQDYGLKIMRNESNNRVYTDEDIKIFKKIVGLKAEGANIHLIRKILVKEEMITEVPTIVEENKLDIYSIEVVKEQLKSEFEAMLDQKLEQHEQRIRNQINTENQKLINYLENSRQAKKSIWNRLFEKK